MSIFPQEVTTCRRRWAVAPPPRRAVAVRGGSSLGGPKHGDHGAGSEELRVDGDAGVVENLTSRTVCPPSSQDHRTDRAREHERLRLPSPPAAAAACLELRTVCPSRRRRRLRLPGPPSSVVLSGGFASASR